MSQKVTYYALSQNGSPMQIDLGDGTSLSVPSNCKKVGVEVMDFESGDHTFRYTKVYYFDGLNQQIKRDNGFCDELELGLADKVHESLTGLGAKLVRQ